MSLPRCARSFERSTMTRISALLVLLVSCSITLAMKEVLHQDLCRISGCKCLAADHPSWLIINCTLLQTQKLHIYDGDLPETTTELIVNGSAEFILGYNSLTRLQDLRHISISGVKLVVLRRGAAIDLNVVNAYLEIDHCDTLRVEGKAFNNIRGPLTVTIKNCGYVSMEGDAFSWLLKMTINNVVNLVLSSGSFTLDPSAANVGEHGPGMSIELKNLTAPAFPAHTFGSSAAEIVMDAVVVHAVQTGAFSANTYNVIMATDCTFGDIDGEAFAQKSLINNLNFRGCKIRRMAPKSIQSAITKLDISRTRFDMIETGAINATVATVRIADSEFHTFMVRGFELSSWNKLYMGRNKFDEMAPYAIVAPTTLVHEMVFIENEIEGVDSNSFEFIGQTFDSRYAINAIYKNNYFGKPCQCNISTWLGKALSTKNIYIYESESYCTVNEFFARCFNEPEQNMIFKKFLDKVCNNEFNIKCENYKTKTEGKPTEIKNPRFPHKKHGSTLSDGDKKMIGIVVMTALGCIVVVILITFIRWMKRRGYCADIKNILLSSNTSCGSICNRLCICGRNSGLDNARSVSQLSIQEYSERRRLNEPRQQEIIHETSMSNTFVEENLPMDDKTTQTLPEELTKELLENLKEKLEDPENYVEAREMIEHLYELIKVEESCNNSPTVVRNEENIYELPFQNTTPRIGKNKKQMISIGTRVPSLDKLLPLSPYNRQTALAHEYFEPKDFAVHLYAEIANNDKEKRNLLGTIPDIVEQVPRDPYVRSIRERNTSVNVSSPSKSTKTTTSSPTSSNLTSPSQSTIKSNKSSSSNSSVKMINRPLPEKPVNQDQDAGEGTSATITLKG